MGIIRYLKCMGIMVKALAISLRSENSTFAPSGWFMHVWSHIIQVHVHVHAYMHLHCAEAN